MIEFKNSDLVIQEMEIRYQIKEFWVRVCVRNTKTDEEERYDVKLKDKDWVHAYADFANKTVDAARVAALSNNIKTSNRGK